MPKQWIIFLFLSSIILTTGCGLQPSQPEGDAPAVEDQIEKTSIFETEVSKAATEAAPSPTATLTPTPAPTETPTLIPSSTPEKIGSEELSPYWWERTNPYTPPEEIWDGIPIHPEAAAGDEAFGGYYYSVEITLDEVKEYYQRELGQEGYRLSAFGEGERTIKAVFTKEEDQIVISALRMDIEYDKSTYIIAGETIVQVTPEFHGSWILIEH